MNRRMLALALAASLLPGLALADEKTTVYKSKGASGETVYSQVEMTGSEEHQVGINEPDAPTEEGEAAPKSPAQVACDRARANLEVLSSEQAVTFDRDGDGTPEVMTDEEKAKNREMAQRQVTAYCEPVAEGE